jgi:hypothetical protein
MAGRDIVPGVRRYTGPAGGWGVTRHLEVRIRNSALEKDILLDNVIK